MCYKMQEKSTYIYCEKARLVYRPTALAGVVLKSNKAIIQQKLAEQ